MLSFALYELIKHPEAMAKIRAEVDEVISDRTVQLSDLSKMPYTVAVMRETLRVHPTVTIRIAQALKDTTIGDGKYAVSKGQWFFVNINTAHRDPAVFGADVSFWTCHVSILAAEL